MTSRIHLFFAMSMFLVFSIFSQTPVLPGSAELEIALEKLNILGSVLYIGAHPDDENTSLLTCFSKGRKYRSAYLSLTRGEGGQNLIGPELGAQLGILRTQELLSARRIDGAEQYFTRAVDFGYSKTAEESFAFWGREKILADIVWVIRCFRPDIIVTRFTADNTGGHGHHSASTILTKEAFEASGDPKRFPEQLKLVTPWKAKRLLWNVFRWGSGEAASALKIDTGEYNPLLGESYAEMAGRVRSQHKSQGFGSQGRRGAQFEQFEVIAGEPAAQDIFDGIDASWNRVRGGSPLAARLNAIQAAYDPRSPSGSIPGLLDVYDQLQMLEQTPWVSLKKREILSVIQACAGLWLEAVGDDFFAVPGKPIRIKATVINRSPVSIIWKELRFQGFPADSQADILLKPDEPQSREAGILIPENFPLSQPYWLENPPLPGSTVVADQKSIGLAENRPALQAVIGLEIAGRRLEFPIPILYRWTDPVAGELYRALEIRPQLTIEVENKVQLFPGFRPGNVKVRVRNHSPNVEGLLRLSGPEGWAILPESVPLSMGEKDGEFETVFQVIPPKTTVESVLRAEVEIGGKYFRRSLVEISYPHIHRQVYFPESTMKAVSLDVKTSARKIGYIMGAGDEVAEAMRTLGCEVTLLSDERLESGDLSGFDAVVTGVRAFNTRERLPLHRDKLLRYVKNGGTLVVQYNVTPRRDPLNLIAPYPLTLGRDRVCVETAPVEILEPDLPLLRFPNAITAHDFDGWIQERGLYFVSQWDDRYRALFSSHDPDEPGRQGGLLYAPYGKGVYIYTAYSWFRQLPAGVPGAFRLWANLISAGKQNDL